MGRPLFILLAGLFGAALLHIMIVLAIPRYADRDAWTRIRALGATNFFHILQTGKADGLTSANPFTRTAVCRFEITNEPVRVTAFGSTPYWSLAIFDPSANEIYSMNDRTATDGELDIVVVTPLQMIGFRKSLPEGLVDSVLIEFPETMGYLVLRTVSPDDSWEAIVREFLGEATCQPVSAI
jgi:uncharacterized membrane protein